MNQMVIKFENSSQDLELQDEIKNLQKQVTYAHGVPNKKAKMKKKAAPAKGYENENVDNAFMTQFP